MGYTKLSKYEIQATAVKNRSTFLFNDVHLTAEFPIEEIVPNLVILAAELN
jgi:hypothetical protein